MVKHESLDKADKKIKKFLKEFDVTKDDYVLEIEGKPLLKVVSPWKEKTLKLAKKKLLSTLEKIWDKNKDFTEGEVEKDVEEAVKTTREQRLSALKILNHLLNPTLVKINKRTCKA